VVVCNELLVVVTVLVVAVAVGAVVVLPGVVGGGILLFRSLSSIAAIPGCNLPTGLGGGNGAPLFTGAGVGCVGRGGGSLPLLVGVSGTPGAGLKNGFGAGLAPVVVAAGVIGVEGVGAGPGAGLKNGFGAGLAPVVAAGVIGVVGVGAEPRAGLKNGFGAGFTPVVVAVGGVGAVSAKPRRGGNGGGGFFCSLAFAAAASAAASARFCKLLRTVDKSGGGLVGVTGAGGCAGAGGFFPAFNDVNKSAELMGGFASFAGVTGGTPGAGGGVPGLKNAVGGIPAGAGCAAPALSAFLLACALSSAAICDNGFGAPGNRSGSESLSLVVDIDGRLLEGVDEIGLSGGLMSLPD
jgi:hypothetical protein